VSAPTRSRWKDIKPIYQGVLRPEPVDAKSRFDSEETVALGVALRKVDQFSKTYLSTVGHSAAPIPKVGSAPIVCLKFSGKET